MYKEEHIQEGVNLCKNSLIGKILSNKPFSNLFYKILYKRFGVILLDLP
jgi:hypothetical protein